MRVCLDHTSLGSIISEMQPESLWTAGLRSRTSGRNSHSSRPAQVQEIARQIRRHDPQPPKHSGRESQAPTMDLQVQRRNWTRTPGRAISSGNMFLFRFCFLYIILVLPRHVQLLSADFSLQSNTSNVVWAGIELQWTTMPTLSSIWSQGRRTTVALGGYRCGSFALWWSQATVGTEALQVEHSLVFNTQLTDIKHFSVTATC